jgi:hypothetical protein
MKLITCIQCKEVKSEDEFSVKKGTKNGVQSRCRKCYKEYKTKIREENQRIIEEGRWDEHLEKHFPIGMKICSMENIEYPIEFFAKRLENVCGLQGKCKLCAAYESGKEKHEIKSPDQEMISKEEYREVYFGMCYYGLDRPHTAYGVDRINSDEGYIKGNVRSVCFTHNKMKSNYDEKEFVERCKDVVESERIREEQRVNVPEIKVKVGL